GQLVTTTEWVDGPRLAKKLEEGPLILFDGIVYLCQALSALGYAHRHGVVHREIATDHMIVTPEGTVKLTGFGLAKSATDPQLTRAGTVMGWLEYMSPEQVKGMPSDPRSDIYSLGTVLYEVATGTLPFVCQTQFDLMMAHVKTEPKPPVELNAGIPAPLNDIILKAMAKDSALRFQTAEEFHDALESVLSPEWAQREEIKRGKQYRSSPILPAPKAPEPPRASAPAPTPAPAASHEAPRRPVDLPPPPRQSQGDQGHWADKYREVVDKPLPPEEEYQLPRPTGGFPLSGSEMMALGVVALALVAFLVIARC
ncbi:MAG: serine/threonine protein kinase, partial [Bryobacteraceae bacterium]